MSTKGNIFSSTFGHHGVPPCRRQTPYLKQLFERYDKWQFSIVGISFDTNREEWKEYIQKNQIKWAQLIDQKGWESTAILTYAIQGIPHLILLGPDGKIIANNPSEKQLSNILSNQLKQ
ncbi:TlpA family protein disulfide reductase [Barnesiella intestinihominis]|uniref:TlpA family protein disulfide reductase n=1 Tax=Barnesiella intestinihominis TaxID=487174 RepID=UPI0034603419